MNAAKWPHSLIGPEPASERGHGFRAVGVAVSKLGAPIVGKRGGGLLVRLKSDWPAIVGTDWAAVSWPTAVARDGCLKLRTTRRCRPRIAASRAAVDRARQRLPRPSSRDPPDPRAGAFAASGGAEQLVSTTTCLRRGGSARRAGLQYRRSRAAHGLGSAWPGGDRRVGVEPGPAALRRDLEDAILNIL